MRPRRAKHTPTTGEDLLLIALCFGAALIGAYLGTLLGSL